MERRMKSMRSFNFNNMHKSMEGDKTTVSKDRLCMCKKAACGTHVSHTTEYRHA